MRTLKELLVILRDNARVKKTLFGPRIKGGLCREANILQLKGKITEYEEEKLHSFLRDEARKKGYSHRKDYVLMNPVYLFKPGRWRCRKRWLNKQIKQLD